MPSKPASAPEAVWRYLVTQCIPNASESAAGIECREPLWRRSPAKWALTEPAIQGLLAEVLRKVHTASQGILELVANDEPRGFDDPGYREQNLGLRIAYVVTRSEPIGGAQIHVRDLAGAVRERGFEPAVITGGAGALTAWLREGGVRAIVLRHLDAPIAPWQDALAYREIRAALRDLSPQLVSTHSSKAGVLGRLAARSLGLPTLHTAHGWSFTPGIPSAQAACYRWIERLAGLLADRIITVSEFDRELALRSGVGRASQLVTIHNGMPDVSPAFRADPSRSPPRLVMVARFEHQKDHATLLRALAGLKRFPWELDLIGDGPLMGSVESLAAELGIGDRIHFRGQRLDVAVLLAKAQISLLTTNWEGFPRSILEAMRAGLPVVASAVGGIAESVADGETGYLVPRGDTAALQLRIEQLLADPALRQRLGANGRRSYETRFTLGRTVAKTIEVYHELVSQGADTPAPGQWRSPTPVEHQSPP